MMVEYGGTLSQAHQIFRHLPLTRVKNLQISSEVGASRSTNYHEVQRSLIPFLVNMTKSSEPDISFITLNLSLPLTTHFFKDALLFF